MKNKEQLEKEIWDRYGCFELSHDKNVAIVQNILEYILKERREYAQIHVKAALKAAHRNFQAPEEDIEFTLSAYPKENIQ
jgi:hypothetical protein